MELVALKEEVVAGGAINCSACGKAILIYYNISEKFSDHMPDYEEITDHYIETLCEECLVKKGFQAIVFIKRGEKKEFDT